MAAAAAAALCVSSPPPPPPPSYLEWREVGVDEAGALSDLLRDDYIGSADGTLHTLYSRRLLRWLLGSPSRNPSLSVALACAKRPHGWSKDPTRVRGCAEAGAHMSHSSESQEDRPYGALVGYVCALPLALALHGVVRHDAVEVTLLSVRKGWRGQGVARRLLAELRRRGREAGVGLAVYTSAQRRGEPVLSVRCHHRPLRIRPLVRRGFCELPHGMVDEDAEAALPPLDRAPTQLRLRRLRRSDADGCRLLMCRRAKESELGVAPTLEQFCHKFVGAPTVCSLVLPGELPSEPARAFVSFLLQAVRTACGRPIVQAVLLGLALAPGESVYWVLAEALWVARRRGAHVFNALPLGDVTATVLARLGFGEGDGDVHVYLEDSRDAVPIEVLDPSKVDWIPLP